MTIDIDKYRDHPLFALALEAFNGTMVKKARERRAAIACKYYDSFLNFVAEEGPKQKFDQCFRKELRFLALGDAPGARLNAARMRKIQKNILEKNILSEVLSGGKASAVT